MKHQDPLLKGVQRIARERDRAADPRWDALAAGALSEQEVAELEQEAARSTPAGDAYALFRPFEPEVHDRMVARVLAQAEQAEQAGGAPPVVDRGARRGRRPLIALLAAAALVLAVALLRRGAGPIDAGLPLSSYEIALAGGESGSRADPDHKDGLLRLADPETRLQITLRPGTEQRSAVTLRAVMIQGESTRSWDPPFVLAPSGTIVVAGTRSELFPGAPDGAWDLVFAVGRPGALPADSVLIEASRARLSGSPRDRAFQILMGRVLLGSARAPGR